MYSNGKAFADARLSSYAGHHSLELARVVLLNALLDLVPGCR